MPNYPRHPHQTPVFIGLPSPHTETEAANQRWPVEPEAEKRAVVLEPFEEYEAVTISSWPRSLDEVRAWCSVTHFPVPPHLLIGWARDPDTEAYVIRERGLTVAYGEIWIDDTEVELGHIIVNPTRRHSGIGRALTTGLVEIGRIHRDEIYLRVVPDNAIARRCYESAGFTRVDAALEAAWNEGQPRTYVWMTAPTSPRIGPSESSASARFDRNDHQLGDR